MGLYGDEIFTINEYYNNVSKTMKISFFGQKMNIKIMIDDEDEKEIVEELSKNIDSVIKTCCSNKELYSYLFKQNDLMFEEINDSFSVDGKNIKDGNDLINAIKENKTNINKGLVLYISEHYNCIGFAGEYWCDVEHGFCITFPKGKYIKSSTKEAEQNKKEKMFYHCTLLQQHSCLL